MALEEPVQVIVERQRAERAVTAAGVAALVQAALSVYGAAMGVEGTGWWTYADAALFAGFGVLMFSANRFAAVVLLLLLALSTWVKLSTYGFPSGLLAVVVFGFFYGKGLQGALALGRLGTRPKVEARVGAHGA